MTAEEISALVARQRDYFRTGVTLDVDWRVVQLRRLREAVVTFEPQVTAALRADLGRTEAEAYLCDVLPTLMELDENIRGVKKWARPERHCSGLACFPSLTTRVRRLPYGVCLVISPFNFPILLSLGVVAAALAGGNTVVLKASSKSAASTQVLRALLGSVFDTRYVAVVDGGHDAADACLEQRFDKIFYTGSPRVAVHVMQKAAENLTPVAFELGGETGNWCVVRKDANLRDAARKIAFIKILNAGQICININQVAVAEEVAPEFLELLKAELTRQIGENAHENPAYPRLIARKAYDTCAATAERYRDRIVFGGTGDPETLKFAPTVVYPVGIDEELVNRELFCPLLPVVPYPDAEIDSLLKTIEAREHGLALYLFTADRHWAERVMAGMQFGGGCVNDVLMHLVVKGVPFNGTGHSGMGAYHGRWGFEEFTHPQTLLLGSAHGNLPLREHPYTGRTGEAKLRMYRLLSKLSKGL